MASVFVLVSRTAPSAWTSTFSVVEPTVMFTSRSVVRAVYTTTSLRMALANPFASTVSLYAPGRTEGNTYAPEAFVVAVRADPVAL